MRNAALALAVSDGGLQQRASRLRLKGKPPRNDKIRDLRYDLRRFVTAQPPEDR